MIARYLCSGAFSVVVALGASTASRSQSPSSPQITATSPLRHELRSGDVIALDIVLRDGDGATITWTLGEEDLPCKERRCRIDTARMALGEHEIMVSVVVDETTLRLSFFLMVLPYDPTQPLRKLRPVVQPAQNVETMVKSTDTIWNVEGLAFMYRRPLAAATYALIFRERATPLSRRASPIYWRERIRTQSSGIARLDVNGTQHVIIMPDSEVSLDMIDERRTLIIHRGNVRYRCLGEGPAEVSLIVWANTQVDGSSHCDILIRQSGGTSEIGSYRATTLVLRGVGTESLAAVIPVGTAVIVPQQLKTAAQSKTPRDEMRMALPSREMQSVFFAATPDYLPPDMAADGAEEKYARWDKREEAIRLSANARSPRLTPALLKVVDGFIENGDYLAALESLLPLLAAENSDDGVKYRVAFAYSKLGLESQANGLLEPLRKTRSTTAAVWCTTAEIAGYNGEFANAIQALKKCEALGAPNLADTRHLIGVNHYRLGNTWRARSSLIASGWENPSEAVATGNTAFQESLLKNRAFTGAVSMALGYDNNVPRTTTTEAVPYELKKRAPYFLNIRADLRRYLIKEPGEDVSLGYAGTYETYSAEELQPIEPTAHTVDVTYAGHYAFEVAATPYFGIASGGSNYNSDHFGFRVALGFHRASLRPEIDIDARQVVDLNLESPPAWDPELEEVSELSDQSNRSYALHGKFNMLEPRPAGIVPGWEKALQLRLGYRATKYRADEAHILDHNDIRLGAFYANPIAPRLVGVLEGYALSRQFIGPVSRSDTIVTLAPRLKYKTWPLIHQEIFLEISQHTSTDDVHSFLKLRLGIATALEL